MNNQKNERFINNCPKKIDTIDIVRKMNENFYKTAIRTGRSEEVLYKEVKLITKLSSEINAEVYNYFKDIENVIKRYFNFIKTIGFLTYDEGISEFSKREHSAIRGPKLLGEDTK